MNKLKTVSLRISGMGLIFYSPFSVANIPEGSDYLESDFKNPLTAQSQAMDGRIVGINLGSSGEYFLNIFQGYPLNEDLIKYEYKFRLGIEVRDEILCVKDLFELINWNKKIPEEQTLRLQNGFYHMTFLSNVPESGIHGDKQDIYLYLKKLNAMPMLKFEGVPMLC